MRDLPLKALRVFETVARRGSFKDAADELCVSQSAVSHQIKHLEDWLGRPLFDRSGHRPQPMEHAQVLSNALQQSLHDIDAACQVARGRPDSYASLVIASIPSVAICWLIPRLSSFQSRHPDIATRIVYAFHGQDIDFTEVDMAFVFANAQPALPSHQVHFFQPGISVPVCNPSLYKTLNLEKLAESITHAGLLHDANIDGWTDWLKRTELDSIPTVTGPVFEDFNLLRAAALSGQGVALCPLALIGTDLLSNRLIQVSDIAVNQNYNYYLINSSVQDSEKIAARTCFVDWIFDTLEQDTPPASQTLQI